MLLLLMLCPKGDLLFDVPFAGSDVYLNLVPYARPHLGYTPCCPVLHTTVSFPDTCTFI